MTDGDKRQELLNACVEEFARYGYEKANTNRICEAAGVSKGLLFHYFGTKKKLYLLCVEQCVSDLLHAFDGFSTEGLGFAHAIAAYGELKLQYFNRHPLHYDLIVGALIKMPEDVKTELAARYEELSKFSAGIIASLIGRLHLKSNVSEQDAFMLVGAVNSIIEQRYIPVIKDAPRDNELYAQISAEYIRLLQLILDGIGEE
ncbi:MAG: TetR/AcrR family transcriptional regulator [Acetanaerobacterium sp.]